MLVPTLLAERAPTQLGGTVLSVLRFGWFCIGAMAHVDRSQSWPRRTPSGSCATQAPRERRRNVCRQESNHERTHEALDEGGLLCALATPAARPAAAARISRIASRSAVSHSRARMSRLPHRGRSVTALEVHLLCLHHLSLRQWAIALLRSDARNRRSFADVGEEVTLRACPT